MRTCCIGQRSLLYDDLSGKEIPKRGDICIRIADHFTCLLRNLYAGQEVTIRALYRTTDQFRVEKGVRHGCLLSPCLFNLYAEHIMKNASMSYKLESRQMGETSTTSDMWMIPP